MGSMNEGPELTDEAMQFWSSMAPGVPVDPRAIRGGRRRRRASRLFEALRRHGFVDKSEQGCVTRQRSLDLEEAP